MQTLICGGNFFEGPRWHAGAWWVSDIYAGQVLRITSEGVAVVIAEVAQEPSGLGWLPDGDLLVVSMKDRKLLRRTPDGHLAVHADLSTHVPWPINDMIVDRQGRAYVGNFGFDMWNGALPRSTGLMRIDSDGTISSEGKGLWFPNGMVITSDGKTLIVAESGGCRLTAFTIATDGTLSQQRVWAQLGEFRPPRESGDLAKMSFGPDGCAIDSDDHVWVADALNNRVCQVAEGGTILREVAGREGWGVYSCALGGDDGHSLLMCIAPDYSAIRRRANREAAVIIERI